MIVGDEVGTEDVVYGLSVGIDAVVLHIAPEGVDEVVIDCFK